MKRSAAGEKTDGGCRVPASTPETSAGSGMRDSTIAAAAAVTTIARPSIPRIVRNVSRDANIGAVARDDDRRQPKVTRPERGKDDECGSFGKRRAAPLDQHEQRSERDVGEERAVDRKIGRLQLGDPKQPRHGRVLDRYRNSPQPYGFSSTPRHPRT